MAKAEKGVPLTDNLRIWSNLSTTDKAYAKSFDRGGFKGTAVNPCYVTKKLTEEFGPCGVGWLLVLEEERYVDGHTLKSGDLSVVHVIRGHLKYCDPKTGEWCETGPQFGQTTFVGENKYGTFTDEEAPKKSISDCLGKCAVLLGCSADIFLGLWDDNKYTAPDTGTSRPQSRKRGAAAGGTKKPAPRSARNSATANGTTARSSPSTDDVRLPQGIENWLPEQYGEYFQDTESAEEFIDVFRFVRTLEWFIDEPETCRMICEIVSDTARQVLTRGSAEWNQVVDSLKEESARLTSLASE
jgi:hypothetical protein